MIEDAEIEKAEELNEGAKPGEVFKPPRLIFVLQAQEYWPGSESNPEAMKRRLLKQKALEETGCEPFGGTFDYKELDVVTYVEFSGYGAYDPCQGYDQVFNPNLPGYRFIIENYPEPERERWREEEEYERQIELSDSSGKVHEENCRAKARTSELLARVAQLQKVFRELKKIPNLMSNLRELKKKELQMPLDHCC
ncbi:hypothetical protein L1049_014804 [Liquidambar formosana]|uniref:Uncharacterized protein n=1 Tax=Liquidambar formosana TaxID=63359 RepID=A0AAP0RXT7_LIQFO